MSVEIIAEVSSNHGGDLILAKEFIHACAEHGADWVKFQTTRVKHLSPADPQYEWFKRAELSDDAHYELKAECEKVGVKFLTTVYNAAEVPFLASLGLEAIKIGSGEMMEQDLAAAVLAADFPRVIVACGIQALFANACPFDSMRTQYLFGHSRYPCPPWLATAPGSGYGKWCYDGWTDHCVGIDACRAAIMAGATIIEKHVQLPNQARPAKPYEATMAELKELRQFADEDPQRFVGRWQHA